MEMKLSNTFLEEDSANNKELPSLLGSDKESFTNFIENDTWEEIDQVL